MEPPKFAPKKMPHSSSRAGAVPSVKVKGRKTVTPRLALMPGMAPKRMPIKTPMLTKMKFSIVRR